MGILRRGIIPKPLQYNAYKPAQNVLETNDIPVSPDSLFRQSERITIISPMTVDDAASQDYEIARLQFLAPNGMRIIGFSASGNLGFFAQINLTATITIQFSLDNGSTWTTLATSGATAVATGRRQQFALSGVNSSNVSQLIIRMFADTDNVNHNLAGGDFSAQVNYG